MQAARLRELRRRPRRGSLERPVNGRLVRTSMLVLVLPLAIVAFTVSLPGPLPAPTLPPSFDATAAVSLATELARKYPSRVPGSTGDERAARWFEQTLAQYGLTTESAIWRQHVPGLGDVALLCARELSIAHGMPRVVRVLVHCYTEKSRSELHHVYLEGARALRDDLPE